MGRRRRLLEELIGCLLYQPRRPRDWAPLIQLASETLTIGTLADTVLGSDLEPDLAIEVKDLFIDVLRRVQKRNERIKDQLAELLPTLNAIGVQPILMRGIARIISSPDERSRLLSDIDLLVPAERRRDCAEALGKLDYQPLPGVDEQPLPLVLGRSRDVGSVDMHTILQPFYLQLGFDRIAPFCSNIAVETGTALLPDPTCQLLFYVVHDQLHDGDYWRGLIDVRHMVDIAHAVDDGVNWDRLESFFSNRFATNALHLQLRTAKSLFKIDIPEQHCGGTWAELQLRRRHLQAEFPFLMQFLTLVSIAVEPPTRSRSSTSFGALDAEPLWKLLPRVLADYLRSPNKGKLRLPR